MLQFNQKKWKNGLSTIQIKYGEYNDESNTKVFALEYILAVMNSNPKAINDADEFLKTVDSGWSAPNLFFKDENAKLKFVGKTTFGQNRQLGVPFNSKSL